MSDGLDSTDKNELTKSGEHLPDRVHGLSDQKLRAVEYLVSGLKLSQVAKKVEISREQLWRWRQEPLFRSHLQRLRVELHEARVDKIWSLADKALELLDEYLDAGDLDAVKILLPRLPLHAGAPLPDGPEMVDEGQPHVS